VTLTGQYARVPESSVETARADLLLAAAGVDCTVELDRMSVADVRERVRAARSPSPELEELWSLAAPRVVSVPFAPEDLHLYAPETIADVQAGYLGESWRPEWLVIGDIGGDPVIADTEQSGTPISFAIHGLGEWRPAKVAPTPAAFLSGLAAWLRVLHQFDGERLDEDDDFAVKPGFDEALREALGLVLPPDCVDALMTYIET
jgi:hypothetical protein